MGELQAGSENLRQSLETLRQIGARVFGILSAFLLSLLFSFLIVLDLENLQQGVMGLRKTKLRFIYDEVANSIYGFGSVVGRALEAQFFIALLNMCLTAIGLWVLGIISKISFLSMIVFVCSFIPIAGVFLSSIPICLVALQQSGFSMLLFAVGLITIIHLIEAYVLNPKIYGSHLHMNPVLVLIILTIGGKLFGIWGLFLGLPACRYFFGKAIRDAAEQ